MNAITDLPLHSVGFALVLFCVPLLIFWFYCPKLIRPLGISIVRMVLQLSFIGLYLEYIFQINSLFLNISWIALMVVISSLTTVNRSGLNYKLFVLPLFLSVLVSILIIDGFLFGFVLPVEAMWHAQYLVPMSGMIIGNSMNHNIIGLTTYFDSLTKRPNLYYFVLTNTGSKRSALQPYVTEAFKRALNPLIANMAVIGLISLPGMMTGQILGGNSPSIAIKYQIVIMVSIFTSCSLTLLFSILFTKPWAFDVMGRIGSKLMTREPVKRNKKH